MSQSILELEQLIHLLKTEAAEIADSKLKLKMSLEDLSKSLKK